MAVQVLEIVKDSRAYLTGAAPAPIFASSHTDESIGGNPAGNFASRLFPDEPLRKPVPGGKNSAPATRSYNALSFEVPR